MRNACLYKPSPLSTLGFQKLVCPCGAEALLETARTAPLRRCKTVSAVVLAIVYDPPRTDRFLGPCLDGQYLQVPRDRKGVHPGLAARPRTPGPHPFSGGFNETAFESHLIRGLLVVQIHLGLECDSL